MTTLSGIHVIAGAAVALSSLGICLTNEKGKNLREKQPSKKDEFEFNHFDKQA